MLRAGYENIFRHPARFLSIRVYDEKRFYIRAFWLEPAPVPLYLLLVVLNL